MVYLCFFGPKQADHKLPFFGPKTLLSAEWEGQGDCKFKPSWGSDHGAKALSSKISPRGALRAVSPLSTQIGVFDSFLAFVTSKNVF